LCTKKKGLENEQYLFIYWEGGQHPPSPRVWVRRLHNRALGLYFEKFGHWGKERE